MDSIKAGIGTDGMIKIGFIAVSQAHQFLHWIPAALELARREGVRVEVLSSSRAGLDFVRRYDPAGRLNLVHLRTPDWSADSLFKPPKRWLTLRLHWRRFLRNDLLVTTDSTTELLKHIRGFDRPLVRIRHGAGDRSGSYRDKFSSFDAMLVNGEKDRQSLIDRKLMPADRIAVCGYNKFEAIAPPFDPFDNGRPLAIYNPHFDPAVSSWFGNEERILEAMRSVSSWNFIVAPHVKVAKKHRIARVDEDNLIVDPGSVHSIDMSYVEASSVYIGDASSQVYEFIRRPRPCIFLNPNRVDWRNEDGFAHWRFGQVIEDMSELGPALDRAADMQREFEPLQREALADSIDLSPVPSSVRHADALQHFAVHGRFASR